MSYVAEIVVRIESRTCIYGINDCEPFFADVAVRQGDDSVHIVTWELFPIINTNIISKV